MLRMDCNSSLGSYVATPWWQRDTYYTSADYNARACHTIGDKVALQYTLARLCSVSSFCGLAATGKIDYPARLSIPSLVADPLGGPFPGCSASYPFLPECIWWDALSFLRDHGTTNETGPSVVRTPNLRVTASDSSWARAVGYEPVGKGQPLRLPLSLGNIPNGCVTTSPLIGPFGNSRSRDLVIKFPVNRIITGSDTSPDGDRSCTHHAFSGEVRMNGLLQRSQKCDGFLMRNLEDYYAGPEACSVSNNYLPLYALPGQTSPVFSHILSPEGEDIVEGDTVEYLWNGCKFVLQWSVCLSFAANGLFLSRVNLRCEYDLSDNSGLADYYRMLGASVVGYTHSFGMRTGTLFLENGVPRMRTIVSASPVLHPPTLAGGVYSTTDGVALKTQAPLDVSACFRSVSASEIKKLTDLISRRPACDVPPYPAATRGYHIKSMTRSKQRRSRTSLEKPSHDGKSNQVGVLNRLVTDELGPEFASACKQLYKFKESADKIDRTPRAGWKAQNYSEPTIGRKNRRRFLGQPVLAPPQVATGFVTRKPTHEEDLPYASTKCKLYLNMDMELDTSAISTWVAELQTRLSCDTPGLPGVVQKRRWADLTTRCLTQLQWVDVNSIAYLRDLLEWKKLLPPAAVKLLTRAIPRQVASLFLWYRYGVALTLADTQELLKAFRKALSKLTSFPGRERFYACSTTGFPCSNGAFVQTLNYKVVTDALPTDLRGLLGQLYRWDLLPTPENVWDLIPYSFVVDWFVDLQTWMSEREEGVIEQVYPILATCRSTKTVFSQSPSQAKLSSPTTSSIFESWYVREIMQPLVLPEITEFEYPIFEGFHAWFEATALVAQRTR